MRDLQADLGICNGAIGAPWKIRTFTDDSGDSVYYTHDILAFPFGIEKGPIGISHDLIRKCDAVFIAEAREGWPEAIERAIKAEEQVAVLKEGLERIKTNIEEYHPHNTLALPKFRFAKEYHDIAIQALKELEVSHE